MSSKPGEQRHQPRPAQALCRPMGRGLCLTRFLIVGSWDFSNFRFLHRCTSSDFLLRIESTGAFLECSSDFRLGVSSQSPFRLAASGTSLLSLLIFCSFSNEPGRFDAYLNPGPRFCLYARETQNTNQLYTLCISSSLRCHQHSNAGGLITFQHTK